MSGDLRIPRAGTVCWGTPLWLFRELDAEFGFTVDVCATPELAKCPRYFTPEMDGLAQSWAGETCWMNPPYGHAELFAWLDRARAAAEREGATTVCLVPCKTEQAWWHALVWDKHAGRPRHGVEVRFIEGRLKFQGAKSGATFPCCLVIYRPQHAAPALEAA